MPGKNAENPLSQMHIAAPCQASWDKMAGGEQVRFCQSCYKNVYNLSNMTRTEAVKLVTEHEGNLCVRYYRRADGSIMTEECPVGLRRVQRPLKYLRAGIAMLLTPLLSFAGVAYGYKATGQSTDPIKNPNSPIAMLCAFPPFAAIAAWIDAPNIPPGDAVMGDMGAPATALAPPPPVPQPPATPANNQAPYQVTNDFGHDPAMLLQPATETPRIQLIPVERVVSVAPQPYPVPRPRVPAPVNNGPLRVTGRVLPPQPVAPPVQAAQPQSYEVQTPPPAPAQLPPR